MFFCQPVAEALEHEVSGIPAAVLAAPGHPGVVGLAATKLSELTSLPAFVVAYGENEGAGSARGREEDNLPAALEYAQSQHPNLLARFGGHAQAAGFSLSGSLQEQVEKFKILKKYLLEYYSLKKNAGVAHKGKSIPFDLEVNPSELDKNFVEWFDRFEPFGSGNPAPVFLMKGPKVLGQKWLKDCHLKINIQAKIGPIEALSFNARTRFEMFKGQGAKSEVNYSSVNFWVEPSWNFWQGEKRLQLMINHIEEGK
jgi:single-stranded-DNA-specific exonuclease